MTADLWRISYFSTSTVPLRDLPREIRAIAAIAEHNNPLHAITGILIYDHDRFFQTFEGAHDDLERLMQSVQRDPRHEHITRVVDESAATRAFPDTGMAVYAVEIHDAPQGEVYDLLRRLWWRLDQRDPSFGDDLLGLTRSTARVLQHFRI